MTKILNFLEIKDSEALENVRYFIIIIVRRKFLQIHTHFNKIYPAVSLHSLQHKDMFFIVWPFCLRLANFHLGALWCGQVAIKMQRGE